LKGFYQAIIDKLKEHDCYFKRNGKGDHEIWYSPITDRSFTVDKSCLSRHTANGVMKEAGIDHHF
jgi:hypothetical protein